MLTTNRADLLEPALAERPGRVDLAAELPLPDAAARRALIRLYQGSLVLDGVDLDPIVARTEGVTAAFLKELLRRAAVLAAEADGSGEGAIRVTGDQLMTALDQLLESRSQLTRVLLGGSGVTALVPCCCDAKDHHRRAGRLGGGRGRPRGRRRAG